MSDSHVDALGGWSSFARKCRHCLSYEKATDPDKEGKRVCALTKEIRLPNEGCPRFTPMDEVTAIAAMPDVVFPILTPRLEGTLHRLRSVGVLSEEGWRWKRSPALPWWFKAEENN